MAEFHEIWIEQCEAACDIKENFGLDKALGYLIDEKLMNFVQVSNEDPKFAGELPGFIAEIKSMFEPHEIRGYFENDRRVGALGHVMNDEEYERFRAAGAVDENIVQAAEDVLIMERIKELLLD